MPIQLPNLDDRTWDDLTAEARALIPALQPEWTDHNPSDPGITLVELLAWLTEMLLFGVNQIPPDNTVRFLQLLNGSGWTPPAPGFDDAELDQAVRRTLHGLHERYRAVTADDYEYLLLHAWRETPEAAGMRAAVERYAAAPWPGDAPQAPELRRVYCVPGRDLEADDPTLAAPAHVSVVVLPQPTSDAERHPSPRSDLLDAVWSFLYQRRLLGTRHRVVGPDYVDITVAANLALHEDAPPADALAQAQHLLATFLDPLDGGPDGAGWPFGRSVYSSELYAVLTETPLVDYVEALVLTGARPGASGEDEVDLDAHQLARLARLDLVGYDGFGRRHPMTWTPS
jgi:hypothetical protein